MLTIHETDETRTRQVMGGMAITTITRVIVATPADLPWQELTALVTQCATPAAEAPGEWEILSHPILGEFYAYRWNDLLMVAAGGDDGRQGDIGFGNAISDGEWLAS